MRLLKKRKFLIFLWLAGMLFLAVNGGLWFGDSDTTRARAPDISIPGINVPSTPGPRDIVEIRARQTPILRASLAAQSLDFGAPVHIRIFKEEAALELWVEDGARYRLFKTYDICRYSGDLGPKLRQGDKQAPEGVYMVGPNALNPNSDFHLSFNLGYPNAYDQSHGRTGNFLMVHGDCTSVGCYAMTDPKIEEIYVLVEAALRGGQRAVPVHAFPFRMGNMRLLEAMDHEWFGFWSDLKAIHDEFETSGQVPQVAVANGRYQLAQY